MASDSSWHNFKNSRIANHSEYATKIQEIIDGIENHRAASYASIPQLFMIHYARQQLVQRDASNAACQSARMLALGGMIASLDALADSIWNAENLS